jgi:hypothetical protein
MANRNFYILDSALTQPICRLVIIFQLTAHIQTIGFVTIDQILYNRILYLSYSSHYQSQQSLD